MIKEFIFEEGKYFPSCHAATLAVLKDGDIIAAWFAGSAEGKDDVAIWLSRRMNRKWEVPRKIAKVNNEPHWNPVLFTSGNDSIHLYFKTGKTVEKWISWVISSVDEGVTWTEPVELVSGDSSGGRGPVKNKPIVLSNGTWLAPASVETKEFWKAFADISRDNGKSWEKSNLIQLMDKTPGGKGVIQPSVWESCPGNIHMLLRSTCGKICRSDSIDYGRTWTPAVPTNLPSNNSGIDLIKLDNKRLVLIYNPTDDRKKRAPLRLSISNDNGISWNDCMDVEEDIVVCQGKEFSYPSIIQSGDMIAAVYTWHRRRICFCTIKINNLG